MKPNENNTDCEWIICNEGEILTGEAPNQICDPCPAFKHPDSSGRYCISDPCNWEMEKLLPTGHCETCDLYTRPVMESTDADAVAKDCEPPVCDLSTQILTPGVPSECKTCDAYYHPDAENRNCVQCDRQEGEIILLNGTCKPCPAFTYVGPFMHECIPDPCEEGQIIRSDNETGDLLGDTSIEGEGSWCEDCPDYYAPNDEGTQCVKPPCGWCQKVTKEGTCESCPEFYCADEATGTQCVTDGTCGE